MNLQQLLYKVNITKVVGTTHIELSDITFDSRKIKESSLFVAIKGTQSDGHSYIQQTIEAGAIVVVLEDMPTDLDNKVTYVQVEDSNIALGIIAANFYDNPSEKIKLVGITGTNGKTTIVSLLSQLFGILNIKAGMLSTIQNKIIDTIIPSTHTTADSLQINYLLNEMIKQGCEYCFMEVSSHALAQGRISGLNFAGGVFTNLSQDHLDYHNTFAEYRDVKKSFFDNLPKTAFALTNKDDKNGMKMLEGTKAKKQTYSLKSVSDYKCRVLENQFEGMLLNINKIDVLIHPQSIIHSMVEFTDSSMLAQLSVTDMCFPIQYAITWPERVANTLPPLDLAELAKLNFETPRFDDFPALNLARRAGEVGGSLPAVMNAANEVAVARFLQGDCSFPQIWEHVEAVMDAHGVIVKPNLDELIAADAWARTVSF